MLCAQSRLFDRRCEDFAPVLSAKGFRRKQTKNDKLKYININILNTYYNVNAAKHNRQDIK